MCDGLQRYVLEESKHLLSSDAYEEVGKSLLSVMPLPPEQMSSVYSKLDPKSDRCLALLAKFGFLKHEYDKAKAVNNDPDLPLALKVSIRMNLLTAVSAVLTYMSGELYKVKENVC